MDMFGNMFRGYNEDRRAKEEFALKTKDAGKAYIIDSGIYISGTYDSDSSIAGVLYINRRGLFFQAVPASKCIVIYAEDIKNAEVMNNKRKCIKIDYINESKPETLVMKVNGPEDCVKELKKVVEENSLTKQNNLSSEKEKKMKMLNMKMIF